LAKVFEGEELPSLRKKKEIKRKTERGPYGGGGVRTQQKKWGWQMSGQESFSKECREAKERVARKQRKKGPYSKELKCQTKKTKRK